MGTREQRKSARINRHFVTELYCLQSRNAAEGVTDNISQGGAFIKTKDWRLFQVNDETLVTLFLPPIFSGQDKPVGLRGSAVITRIDQENEGVALKFTKSFQELEQVKDPEVPGKTRYKKISHYLSLISSQERAAFVKAHPKGFLVEISQRALDKKVLFQFSTESLDDEYVMQQSRYAAPKPDILDARIIEIEKRKLDSAAHTITIGRAAINDIVLYNTMVSKSQAYLLLHPTGTPCYLVDSGSKNGTMVNGRLLKPYEKYQLVERDEISFGPQTKAVYFSSTAFYAFLGGLKGLAST
jgi:hypothetical protein